MLDMLVERFNLKKDQCFLSKDFKRKLFGFVDHSKTEFGDIVLDFKRSVGCFK